MTWFKRKRPVNENLKPVQLVIQPPERFVTLPQPDDEILVGDWARETVMEYAPLVEDAGNQSEEDLEYLGSQVAGWAQVHMDAGPSDWGFALVVEASAGVEAYVTVRGFEYDGTFTGPDDVADEDLHDTPIVGERTVERVELANGLATHVSSVRQAMFGMTAGEVRDEEWYVFLEPEHMVVLLHAEWLNPGADDMLRHGLPAIAATIGAERP